MSESIMQYHFRLLCDFDEFCTKNGINYVLANHSAWDAVKFKKYHDGMFDTSVLLLEDDWKKLLESEMPADVVLSLDSFEGNTARFVNVSTTLIDYRNPNRYKIPAAGINIVVGSREGDGLIRIPRPDGSSILVPSKMFDATTRGVLEKREFPIFENSDSYFSLLVSKEWRKKNWPFAIPKDDIEVLFSAEVPYDEFLSRPVVRASRKKIRTLLRRVYWRWRKEKYAPVIKTLKRYEAFLLRTGTRFILWEQLYPMKEELITLKRNGKTEELGIRLAPFVSAIEKFYKQGLGITFDREILNLVLPFVREKHGEKYVEKFLSMIPGQYMEEDISNLLRRKQIEHPLLKKSKY